MRKLNQSDFAVFLLGALVGIYGNWLISFFERLDFNPVYDWVFFVLLGLAVGSFVTFSTYLISAFRGKWRPSLFAGAHVSLTMVSFIFQSIFSLQHKYSLFENGVFWIIGTAIFFSIVPIEWISFRERKYILKTRWKKPKIGILNDMEWNVTNKEILTYTDVPPQKWKELFKSSSSYDIELINVNHNFDKYVAILNPYGGVYPETNLRNLSTLKKIIAFVDSGGVFVNIADIPTYWAYHVKLKRKVDTTKPIYTVSQNQLIPIRPFQLTPLMKELGLSVLNVSPLNQNFGGFSQNPTSIVSERIAILESNIENLVPTNRIGNIDTTAFFTVKYGEGDFLFSLIFLSHANHNQQAKETITKAIVQSTLKKLEEKIKLHK
jgi:hypothetical protein